jgi:copper chaperone CopZ
MNRRQAGLAAILNFCKPQPIRTMKTKLSLTLILTTLAAATLAAEPAPAPACVTNHFTISGMHCDGCAKGLTAELKQTRGVVFAQVTFSNQLAVVAYDTNRVSQARLVQVAKEAGFEARPVLP